MDMTGLEITVTEKPVDMKKIWQGVDDDLDVGVTVRSAPSIDQAPGLRAGPKAVPPQETKWILRRDIQIALTKKVKRNTITYRLWVTISNNTDEEDWRVLEFVRDCLGYGHIGDLGEKKILVIPEGYNALFLNMLSKYVNRKDVNNGLKFLAEKQKEFELNSMEEKHFDEIYKNLLVEEK